MQDKITKIKEENRMITKTGKACSKMQYTPINDLKNKTIQQTRNRREPPQSDK